jgi:hypothetical protein
MRLRRPLPQSVMPKLLAAVVAAMAVVGAVVLRKDIIPGLIILCAAPVTWQLGRLAHHLRGRLELVTVTIVAVALAALIVAVTH